MSSRSRGDLFARVIGFLVFALGIGAIVAVLCLAFDMWRDPYLGVKLPGASHVASSLQDLGIGFGQLIVRIALLFLGSVCGSLIANKGINLYFTGLHSGSVSVSLPVQTIEQRETQIAGK